MTGGGRRVEGADFEIDSIIDKSWPGYAGEKDAGGFYLEPIRMPTRP